MFKYFGINYSNLYVIYYYLFLDPNPSPNEICKDPNRTKPVKIQTEPNQMVLECPPLIKGKNGY